MKDPNPPLTAQELSVLLNISEFMIKELAYKKVLPCRYAGRRPLFDIKAIYELFEKLEGGAA